MGSEDIAVDQCVCGGRSDSIALLRGRSDVALSLATDEAACFALFGDLFCIENIIKTAIMNVYIA